jgi:hypothetical protein
MANHVFKTKFEIGRKLGMLLVTKELIERVYKGKNGLGYDVWERQVECLCDCGNIVNREYRSLVKSEKAGQVSSCGCYHRRKKSKEIPRMEGVDEMTRKEKSNHAKDMILKGHNNVEIRSALGVSHSKISLLRKEMGINYYTVAKDSDIEIGLKKHFLTVISLSDERYLRGNRLVTCKCDCGVIKNIAWSLFNNEKIKSCGCLGRETARNLMKQRVEENRKHGDSNRKSEHMYIYQVWMGMKQRCYNSNNKRYSTYGGKGLTVYEPWINDYLAFKEYVLTNLGERLNANTGRRSDNESMDRIDVNIGYHPGNLRWADFITQANNKTIQSMGHKTRPMVEEETGVKMIHTYQLKQLYEKYYKTKLKKGNVVHHINWDGSDNSKKNLLEVTRVEHGWLHQSTNYHLREETRGSIIKILKGVDWKDYIKKHPRV